MSIFYWSNLNDGTVWSAQISDLETVPQLSNPQLFFSDFIETSDLDSFAGIFIDEANKKFYWADPGGNTIFMADISDPTIPTVPTNPTILFSDGNLSSPAGLFVDTVNSKLYWTNNNPGSDAIWVGAISDLANPTEPSDQHLLLFISDPLVSLTGVCLDIPYSKIYWSQSFTNEIWVGDVSDLIDPKVILNPVILLSSDAGISPSGLFFDPINSKLYWTDQPLNRIFAGNISDRANPVLLSDYSILTSDNLAGPVGLFIIGLSSDVNSDISSDLSCVLIISDLHGGPVCTNSPFDISFSFDGVSDAHCTLIFNDSDYENDFAAGSHSFNVPAPSIASDYVATLSAYDFLNSDCSDVKTTTITIKSLVNVDAGSDQTIAAGSDAVIGVGSAEVNVLYTWSPTDGVSDVNVFPTTVSPSDTTTYTVIAERTDVPPGCIASDSVTITVIGASDCNLSVDAGSDQMVCKGSAVTLGVGSALSDVTYVWSPSDGIINIHAFPATANVCNSQTYTVTATRVNNSDCASSDSTLITISDCSDASNLSSYSDNVTFFQSCKNCPTVNISIKHKSDNALTLDEFFSSDGSDANFDDSMFISSYAPVKKNIGVNKLYSSDLGFGYVCYTYSNGLTVVRQENGGIILVNNGDINIDSSIDLGNVFHFGDWIDPNDSVSSDKMQPDLIIMSNKGSVNINQDVTVPGLITCMAPNGHVRVACEKTLTSSFDRVIIMASDNNHGAGTINAFIKNDLPLFSDIPSSDILEVTLTNDVSGTEITNTSDTITITTNKSVVISANSSITKNLVISTPASVIAQNITAFGRNISITAGHLYTSDIDTSNFSSSDNADGGEISLLSQNEIVCRNLSTNGGNRGSNGISNSDGDGDGGSGGADGDGGIITLIAGASITTAVISANGGSTGGNGISFDNTSDISSDFTSDMSSDLTSDLFGDTSTSSEGGDGGQGGIDGDGGIITLIAGTSITTTAVFANGGSTGGIGGNGGSTGGAGGDGNTDGDGGIITFIAGTSITTTAVSVDGGSSGGLKGGGSSVDGAGGDGGQDGDGGIIILIAGTSIITTELSANGGSRGGYGGSAGISTGSGKTDGDGGIITLIAGTSITTTAIFANGGSTGGIGGSSSNDAGMDADGGTITLIAGAWIITKTIAANGGGTTSIGSSGKIGSFVDRINTFLGGSNISSSTNCDGGSISLIACGDIVITSASALATTETDSIAGNILIKSYGLITGAPASTSDIQIVRMRDLQLSLSADNTVFSSGSDVTFTLNVVNQGSLVKPATTITIGVEGVSPSDVFILPETNPQTFTLSDLLPGLSDSFTTTVTNLIPGKFMYTAVMPDACVSDVYFVNVAGSTTVGKLELTMTGSLLSLIFYMPDYFNQAFPGVTDFKILLSDMCVYSQSSDLIMGLEVADQSDVFNSDAVILQGRRNVRIECSDDGNILFAKATNDSYVLGLFNYASDPLIVFYSDKVGPLVNKMMSVVSDSFSTIAVTQPGADLDIIGVAPSDIGIKLNDEATFDVIVKNNGPIDVADAFIRIGSNLNEMFSDKFIGFLPSDGTLISDTITITPTVPGHHVLSFEIDSTAVVNTNTVTNIFGDILLDVCQLDIAMTTNGSIVVFPNFPFSVPFDLTKAGGNPTAHVTAKISDVVHHQQDFAAGSHTIVVSPPEIINNNTIIKLEASDKNCFDTDFHVIQVIDSLADVANLLGTTFSDIKDILSANDPFVFIERFFGVSNVLPRLPDNLIDQIWDVPIFTKFLPALGDLLAELSGSTPPPPPPSPPSASSLGIFFKFLLFFMIGFGFFFALKKVL